MKNNVLLKHAEPQHGHGKWKSALKHTLLILGMVLMSMGAFAQVPSGGLYLHKTWIPDPTDPTGGTGEIMLETFVTGEQIIIEKNIPSDIVLVLDVSTSMRATRGTQSRPSNRALTYNMVAGARTVETNYTYNNYQLFAEEYDGRYYLYYNSSGADTRNYFRTNGNITDNRNDAAYSTSPDEVIYTFAYNSRLRQGSSRIFELKKAVAGFIETVNQMDLKEDGTRIGNKLSIITYSTDPTMHQELAAIGGIDIEELQEEVWNFALTTGTCPSFGINLANTQFANNPHTDETLGEDFTRTLVLFTDGEPYDDPKYGAVSSARTSKQTYGAKVYSIGMFSSSPAQNSTTWNFLNYISSNYPNAYLTGTGENSGDMQAGEGGNANADFYMDASSTAIDLSDIFQTIAEASGGSSFDLGSSTVVQDVISPSFQLNLPQGVSAGTVIRAYAPKCIGKTGDAFIFADPTDGATRMELDANGVVVGDHENRLKDNIVQYNATTQTLTFSGFNFNKMYVAQQVDDQGNLINEFTGRKLLMFIPLEIGNGSWGDGINTNGPMSVIYPNNDTGNPIYFNNPTANVLGSVWTEVITTMPDGFDANNIDSPEDLAWFISEVNGRCGYTHNNTVASHPNLNGRLTADIDMSAHNWVPIGAGYVCAVGQDGETYYSEQGGNKVKLTYEGTFDGNGHVITGLKNNASKYYKLIENNSKNVVVFPGMFSTVSGTVKNVFVLDADFRGKNHNNKFVYHGIIADTLLTSGNIFNCEAAGRITCNNDDLTNDKELVFGGLVGLNEGTVHSCMAMAELTAYTMGGMIGKNNGSFSNGFTNGVYNYLNNGVTGKYTGGIAAINSGSIDNCYVRFERPNTNLTSFGMIYGTNTGEATATNCYTPQIVTYSRPDYLSVTEVINTNSTVPTTITEPAGNDVNSYTLSISPSFYNMFTNDNMTAGEWGTTLSGGNTYNTYNGTPLLDKLNENKGDNGASWKRTTAGRYTVDNETGYVSGDINDDYPVLMFNDYTCLASADGIRIDYASSLKDMLHRHNNGNMNENTNIVNEFTAINENYYKVSGHAAITGGAINLYAHDDVTLETTGSKDGVADNCTAEGVVVYIDENISLLQDASSSIEAYTGQTLQAFNNTDIQAGNRWHNISSSLSNSKFGWYYTIETQEAHSWSNNPCGWTIHYYDEDEAFFPIDLNSRHRADFYCFFEPEYHWINFKRNGVSHWHMDDYTRQIQYEYTLNGETHELENEEQFIPGKGYLTAVDMSTYWEEHHKQAQFIQNRGTLNNGSISIPVTYTSANEWTGLAGYNLLGNPYQSYLDFTTFAWANANLWSSDSQKTYAIYDPSSDTYVQGTAGEQPSQGALADSGDINMHQGFFIRVASSIAEAENPMATFTNDMRSNVPASGTHFRGSRPDYPLVNFIVSDAEGNTDVAVLEVGRPENGGAMKLRVGSANGRISLRHEDEDFGILFRDMTSGSQPLYFEAMEDGVFTLSWNTANANFSSLTLIDNITGVSYDMLAHDSYTFEGSVEQYRSRFKVVFGEFTDVEENEETVTDNFAFFDGNEWVVNGQGQLTVTDIMGRTVYSTTLSNDQNRVSLNGLSQGVYLMRVSNSNNSMVQKIVVR